MKMLLLIFMILQVRARSHGGGGPWEGEVPRLGGVANLFIQSLSFS